MLDYLAPWVALAIMFGLAVVAFRLLEPWLQHGLDAVAEDFERFLEPVLDGYRNHLGDKAKRIAKKRREVDRA